jgi:hypothetical protein
LFLVVDFTRIRGNLTAETTLASKDNDEARNNTRPHEEVDPSRGDDVVLSQSGAQVGGANEVELQGDNLTVANGFAHVNVFGHDRGTKRGSDGSGGNVGANTDRGNNTAEHMFYS